MYITIRLDDITPNMNWEKFNRIKSILDSHGVKPLIGVVPDCKDDKLNIDASETDFWGYIRELQENGWVVAMHGLNHLYTTKDGGLFPLNKKSEFAGHDYETQDKMIKEGRRILESNGVHTDIFMAPSHSYDRNTLKALISNGFARITDGFGAAPYRGYEGIVFFPIAIKKEDSLKSDRSGITTFVYHTNTMNDKAFAEFERIFERAKVVSYSEFYKYNIVSRNIFGNIIERLAAKGKYLAVKARGSR